MSINSITTGSTALYHLQPVKPTGSTDSPANGAVAPNADSNKPSEKLPSPVVAGGNDSKPAGVASHVVISYNPQGKIRTKFVDSRNNVVYQIPSEMVAKLEDQMQKPETSTSVKG